MGQDASSSNELQSPLLDENLDSNGDHVAVDLTTNIAEVSPHLLLPTKGFTPFIAVCFTVNFMVGTGFLTLPWAFVQGGIILSSILIIVSSIFSDYIKDFVLESMARAEAIVPYHNACEDPKKDDDLEAENDGLLMVKERKFELSDLTRVFLGERISIAYVTMLTFSLFMTLWVYTVVFDAVFINVVPISDNKDINAAIFTILYGCIVVPITCLELKEQVSIQVTLAMCRVLMFTFMVTTSFFFPEEFRNIDQDNNFIAPPMYNLLGVSRSLPIILFALQFQTTVPGISKAVADKRQLSGIFRFTFFLCAVSYTLVGVTVGLAAGEGVAQSANVMWKNFRGGTGELTETGEYINVALWAKAISYFVVMFPAIDVISAFPLNGIVMTSNVLDVVYRNSPEKKFERKRVVIYRLLCSVPPVLCAIFIRNLGVVTDYAGIIFFVLTFCFPALFFMKSKGEGGTSKETYYRTWGTNIPFAIFTNIIGTLCFFFLSIGLTARLIVGEPP